MFRIKNVIVLLVLLSLTSTVSAQTDTARLNKEMETMETYIHAVNSPRGNFISNYSPMMSLALKDVDYFIVTRSEITTASKTVKTNTKQFKVRPVQSAKELKNVLGEMDISEFGKMFGVEDKNLVKYFNDVREPDSFGLAYLLVETQIAAGHVFLDNDIETGKLYLYEVSWKNTNGTTTKIGEAIVNSDEGNFVLEHLNPAVSDVDVYDSSVLFRWNMDVSNEVLSGIPNPETSYFEQDVRYSVIKQMTQKPIAQVYCLNGLDYQKEASIIGNLLPTESVVVFEHSRRHKSKELNACYVQIEDFYGNKGQVSDTAYAYAINKRNLPILMGINVTEEEDAIRIGWDPLPNLPYVAGVLVYRYSGESNIDTVGIAHPGDTSIMDFNIVVGETYRYKAKTLFSTGVHFEQENPAEATGQYTKFSKPDLPTNLRATSIGQGVQLEWDHTSHQSTFGYFIYRGTKPNKVDLLYGPVKELTFLDTSKSLSGRSTYYYRIMAQNYRQDTSQLSEYVSINPEKEIEMGTPENMEFYFENGSLHITWQDIRIYDNAIDGYILEKRIKGTGEDFYERIEEVLTKNEYVDTTVRSGDAFEYRVAALSYRGDEGDFSSPALFDYQTQNTDFIEDFIVRNSNEGIYVSIPALETDERVSYTIYRRTAKERSFKKLVGLKPGAYDYTDTSVQDGTLYVYAVTIINKQGKESKLSFSQSVRRGLN